MTRQKHAAQVANDYAHAMIEMSERMLGEQNLTKAKSYVSSAILHAQTEQQRAAARKLVAKLGSMGVVVPYLTDPEELLRNDLSKDQVHTDVEALVDRIPRGASSLRNLRRLCTHLGFEDLRERVDKRIDTAISPITISDGIIEPALSPPRKDTWIQ